MPTAIPSPPHIVLASASPRRLEMLESLGLVPLVRAAAVDETPLPGEPPANLAQRLAIAKARAIDGGNLCVLAADTVVVASGAILGKPADENEARAMWRRLSGTTHKVITGVALRMPDGHMETFTEETEVVFRPLRTEEFDAHAAAGRFLDKAGGYAIQGYASAWVERISGSYTNVVGLPLAQVVAALYRLHPAWPALPWRHVHD